MLGAVLVNWVIVANCTLDLGDWRWRMTKVATNFTISSWYPDKKNDFRRHNALQWTLKSVEGAPRRWVTGPKVVGMDDMCKFREQTLVNIKQDILLVNLLHILWPNLEPSNASA
jgi:hypothetical protein